MGPVAPICICLVVCSSAAVASPPPLLPEAYVAAMADELSGENILPGFRCTVKDIFQPLDDIETTT